MAKDFIVRPRNLDRKEDKSIVMTIRVDRELQEKFDELADKTNRSRNELISLALHYALDNLEVISDKNLNLSG